jgi:hypothetical protein
MQRLNQLFLQCDKALRENTVCSNYVRDMWGKGKSRGLVYIKKALEYFLLWHKDSLKLAILAGLQSAGFRWHALYNVSRLLVAHLRARVSVLKGQWRGNRLNSVNGK